MTYAHDIEQTRRLFESVAGKNADKVIEEIWNFADNFEETAYDLFIKRNFTSILKDAYKITEKRTTLSEYLLIKMINICRRRSKNLREALEIGDEDAFNYLYHVVEVIMENLGYRIRKYVEEKAGFPEDSLRLLPICLQTNGCYEEPYIDFNDTRCLFKRNFYFDLDIFEYDIERGMSYGDWVVKKYVCKDEYEYVILEHEYADVLLKVKKWAERYNDYNDVPEKSKYVGYGKKFGHKHFYFLSKSDAALYDYLFIISLIEENAKKHKTTTAPQSTS